jgi:hypothetical protein
MKKLLLLVVTTGSEHPGFASTGGIELVRWQPVCAGMLSSTFSRVS